MKMSIAERRDSEGELSEIVASHLAKAGYTIHRNLSIRTWRPDIVAARGEEVVVVEIKGRLGDVRSAIAQAAAYATDATYAYVAVPPSQLSPWLRTAAGALGIGILAVSDRVRIAVRPERHEVRPSLLRRVRKASKGGRARTAARSIPGATLGRALRHLSILKVLLGQPGREFTIREVAREAQTSYATTWRVVQELAAMGILTSKRAGYSHLVSLNDRSPVTADLRRLASVEVSPHRHAARRFATLLAGVPEVRAAVLFGSASKGLERPTSDVDVAVIIDGRGTASVRRIRELADRALDETGLAVVPIVVGAKEVGGDTQLAKDIRRGEVLYERPR